jgi:ribonuclease HI
VSHSFVNAENFAPKRPVNDFSPKAAQKKIYGQPNPKKPAESAEDTHSLLTQSISPSMVYIMEFYVDGGCRGNGRPGSIGAAAAVMEKKYGKSEIWTRSMPSIPTPTNQRAEITAIILALEVALDKLEQLETNPYLDVKIYSDSKYAVECMSKWIYKWCKNGWINAAGNEVANRDLIENASDLDDRLKEKGDVEYIWIPREKNQRADQYCNEEMDKQ